MRSLCASSESANCFTTGIEARLRFVFGSFATPPQAELPSSFSASFLVPQTDRLTLSSLPSKFSHARPRISLLRSPVNAAVCTTVQVGFGSTASMVLISLKL